MHASARRVFVPALIAAASLSTASRAGESDLVAAMALHPVVCAQLSARQSKDLRLAVKAQGGESPFLQHVRFLRPYERWTALEAIERAQSAIQSPCGKALGLREIDAESFPSLEWYGAR